MAQLLNHRVKYTEEASRFWKDIACNKAKANVIRMTGKLWYIGKKIKLRFFPGLGRRAIY